VVAAHAVPKQLQRDEHETDRDRNRVESHVLRNRFDYLVGGFGFFGFFSSLRWRSRLPMADFLVVGVGGVKLF
jgi:hypothetical protein